MGHHLRGRREGLQSHDWSVPPRPRRFAVEALVQNSLWDTILAFQDGVGGLKFGDGDAAARLGHLSLIQSLSKPRTHMHVDHCNGYNEPLKFTVAALDGAAAQGHLEVVRWLDNNRPEGGTSRALIDAASHGHKHVVEWLLNNRGDGDVWRALDAAASTPSVTATASSTISISRSRGSTPMPSTRTRARALERAKPAAGMTATEARPSSGPSSSTVVELLESLRDALPAGLTGLSIRERVVRAAGSGRVEILEWLRWTQCGVVDDSLDNEVYFFRLYGKDLTEEPEILLLEYSQDALVAAAGEGHVHVLEWFRDYGVYANDPSNHHRRRAKHPCYSSKTGNSDTPAKRSGKRRSLVPFIRLRNAPAALSSSVGDPGVDCVNVPSGGGDRSGSVSGAHGGCGRSVPDAGGERLMNICSVRPVLSSPRPLVDKSSSSVAVDVDDPAIVAAEAPAAVIRNASKGRRRFGAFRGRDGLGGGDGDSDGTSSSTVHEGDRSVDMDVRWLVRQRRAEEGPRLPRRGVLRVTAAVEDAAAAGGHLEVLRWIAAHAAPAYPLPLSRGLLSRQASVVSPKSKAGRCSSVAFVTACEAGHLSTAVWLASERFDEVQEAENCLDKAAKNGHLDVVKWLSGSISWSSAGFRWTAASKAAMDGAAAGGHLHVVRWLHEHRSEGCTTRAMNRAARGGHLETVIWLHRHRTEGCTTKAIDLAAAGGHLDTVKWLHDNRSEGCTPAAMDGAAENNCLETLQWLRTNRSEGWTLRAATTAANNGHLAALAYLLLGSKADKIGHYTDGYGGFAGDKSASSWVRRAGCGVVVRSRPRQSSCSCLAWYLLLEDGGADQDAGSDSAAVASGDASANIAGAAVGASNSAGAGDTGGPELVAEGGLAPASMVTLDLDETAAAGRLNILQWIRRVTVASKGRKDVPRVPPPAGGSRNVPRNVLWNSLSCRGSCSCSCSCTCLGEGCRRPLRGDPFPWQQEQEKKQELKHKKPQGRCRRGRRGLGSCWCGCPLDRDVLEATAEIDTDYAGWRRLSMLRDGSKMSSENDGERGVGRNRFRIVISTAGVDRAAANGHLEVVRWLFLHRSEGGTSKAVDSAAANGHVSVVDWLNRNTSLRATLSGSVLKPSALELAAANGHLGIVRWFHHHTGRSGQGDGGDSDECFDSFNGFTYRVMDEAAANGHLQVCRWLYTHRGEGCSWNAFDGASARGHTHVLEWLAQKFGRVGPSAVAFPKAAKAGHLHVVQWLQRHYPREADAGCTWAIQELSENSPFEPTGAKRHGVEDPEMWEFIKRQSASSSKAGTMVRLGGAGCSPSAGIAWACTVS